MGLFYRSSVVATLIACTMDILPWGCAGGATWIWIGPALLSYVEYM